MSCNGHGCSPENLSRALLDLSEIRIATVPEMGAQTIGAARHERDLEYRHNGCPSKSESGRRLSPTRDAPEVPFSRWVVRRGGSSNSEEPLDSVQADQDLAQDESRQRAAGHSLQLLPVTLI
jgi:hypothetical protein